MKTLKNQMRSYVSVRYSMVIIILIILGSCSKLDINPKVGSGTDGVNAVPREIIQKLKEIGFETEFGLSVFKDGYLVEGDIYMTASQIKAMTKPLNSSDVPKLQQYKINYTVTASPPRTITIYIESGFDAYLQNACDAALARYDNMNLNFNFERVTSSVGADISITSLSAGSTAPIAVGSWPSSGNPGTSITLNTFYFNSYDHPIMATSVIAHELGHCLGFRHTDYMDKTFSGCSATGANEGTGSLGANHIPNTPTGGDPGSWMLACIGTGVDRPFNGYDVNALVYVYGSEFGDGAVVRQSGAFPDYVIFGGAKFEIPNEGVRTNLYGNTSITYAGS
ncbi:MAG: M57 family metalloprotease [Daejeonella sp.]